MRQFLLAENIATNIQKLPSVANSCRTYKPQLSKTNLRMAKRGFLGFIVFTRWRKQCKIRATNFFLPKLHNIKNTVIRTLLTLAKEIIFGSIQQKHTAHKYKYCNDSINYV